MPPVILVLGPAPEAARATARLLAGLGLDAVARTPSRRRAAGAAGWAALVAEARPRVLVLDVPAASGLPAPRLRAFLARMHRTAPERGAVPAVVVRVARPGTDELRALLAAGASDVMGRDTHATLLARRLETLVRLQRQREQIERKLRYENAVAACARLLGGGGDLEGKLDHVASLLRDATGASRACLFRVAREDGPGLVASQAIESCAPGIASRIGNPALQRMPLHDAAPRVAEALAAGRAFTGIVATMDEPERGLFSGQGILSILVLPVFDGAEPWGFIGFDDCEHAVEWSPDDVALLKIVAEATGLAVERTHAEGEIYRFAVQDALTGLHNRRYMLDRLAQLAGEAARGDARFAVALVDVDFFKQVNDTHGHAAGDLVLQRFAAALQQHFRAYDLVGRHGGEEFLVVMLNAEAAQLAARLDALRTALARQPVALEGGEVVLRFSAGVAASREATGADMVHELLDAADKRLYQAKRAGRDRVVAAARARRRGRS
ncbi:MAG: diguanylate cyclase [Alphaproteobacteria bacterium]